MFKIELLNYAKRKKSQVQSFAAGNSKKSKTNKKTKKKKLRTLRQSVQNILGTYAMHGVGAVLDARAPSGPRAECGLFWVLNKQFCRRGKHVMMRGRLVIEEKKKKQKWKTKQQQQQQNIYKFFTRHGLIVMKYGATL